MIDLYSSTHADISPAHVTYGGFVKKLFLRLSEARTAALGAKARPNCRSCYGRGYTAFQSGSPVPCACTQKR